MWMVNVPLHSKITCFYTHKRSPKIIYSALRRSRCMRQPMKEILQFKMSFHRGTWKSRASWERSPLGLTTSKWKFLWINVVFTVNVFHHGSSKSASKTYFDFGYSPLLQLRRWRGQWLVFNCSSKYFPSCCTFNLIYDTHTDKRERTPPPPTTTKYHNSPHVKKTLGWAKSAETRLLTHWVPRSLYRSKFVVRELGLKMTVGDFCKTFHT